MGSVAAVSLPAVSVGGLVSSALAAAVGWEGAGGSHGKTWFAVAAATVLVGAPKDCSGSGAGDLGW